MQHHSDQGSHIVPKDFNKAVENFDHGKKVSDQHGYDNLLKVTADTLVTLEALRKEIQKIMSEMADIETMIYGHS